VKITRDVYTMTEITFYSMEIDVPDEVASKGESAIARWMNRNIGIVDGAKYSHHESGKIRQVTDIWQAG